MPKLLDKLGIRHRPPLRCEGKNDLINKAQDYADLQLARGATHILFCFDADGLDGESELARLKGRLTGYEVFGYVPVHAIEAWLLADEAALTAVLGAMIQALPNPEADPRPAETLDRLFRAHGEPGGYQKTRHAQRIAKEASDKRLLRCESYRRSTEPFRPR